MLTHAAARRAEDVALDLHRARFANHTVKHWDELDVDTLYKHRVISSRAYYRYASFERQRIAEFGLDGLAIDKNGVAHGIQVKQRTGPRLTANDLGTCTWVSLKMLEADTRSKTFVYCNRPLGYRATDNMPRHFDVFRMENVLDDVDTSVGVVKVNDTTAVSMDIDDTDALSPLWKHQQDALDALRASDFTIGTLAMPCGSGKTRVMMEWEAAIGGRTVVVSPTRKLARQTFGRVVDKTANRLLVDSDSDHAADGYVKGSTDAAAAAAFWKDNERCVVSTTMKSWNAVVRNLQPPPDALIFDEAHHVRTNQLHDGAGKTLLVTATPNQHVDDDSDGDDEDEDDAKPSAYATAATIFHLPISYAIANDIIAEYRLYLPILETGYASDPVARAKFLVDAVFRIKISRRIIVFGSSWEDVTATLDAVKRMHAIDVETARAKGGAPPVDLWTGAYTASLKAKEREDMEERFQTFDGISLLGSVDILREGADLPACDGVYIMDVSTNATRLVQAMMRAMRRSSPNKVASVFLWIPQRDDAPRALRRLHAEDPLFAGKIRGLDSRVIQEGSDADADKWASLEPQWDASVVEAIRVRAVGAAERVVAKARLICDEYVTRKTWTYGKEERFKADLGGGSKQLFVRYTRREGRPGGKGIRDEVRSLFLAADASFFDPPKTTEFGEMTDDQRADAVLAHMATHGKVPSAKSAPFGKWLDNVRAGNTSMDVGARNRLEAAGVPTTREGVRAKKADEMAARIDAVLAYKGAHGGADPPRSTNEGRFIMNVRRGHITLTDEERARLVDAGVTLTPYGKRKRED
jgi:superfamily II DNA or RNA helicase